MKSHWHHFVLISIGTLLSAVALASLASAQVALPAKPSVEEVQQAVDAVNPGTKIQDVYLCVPADSAPDTTRLCLIRSSRTGDESVDPVPMRFEGGRWTLLVDIDARGNARPADVMPACAPNHQILPILRKRSGQPDLKIISGGPNTNARSMFVRERFMTDMKGPYRLNCIYVAESTDTGQEYLFTYQDHDGTNFRVDDYIASRKWP